MDFSSCAHWANFYRHNQKLPTSAGLIINKADLENFGGFLDSTNSVLLFFYFFLFLKSVLHPALNLL